MILITGASDNHFKTLNQFITEFLKFHKNDASITLVVYNLGLSNDNWSNLQNNFEGCNIIYKIFDYSLYPEYVNIHVNFGEYAWKPIIIYDISIEYKNEIIVWMDSGNLILDKLDDFSNYIKENYIYSCISDGCVSKWTHPLTIQYMNSVDDTLLNNQSKNAACLGFDTSCEWVNTFISEFKNLALTKECIAPEGSSRANHRQDQSIFSIMFYQYQKIYKFPDGPLDPIGYTTHKDID